MSKLTTIKKAPYEIAQLLANNSLICSLLLDDSNNPAEVETSFDDLLNSHYITIYPPIEDGSIENFTRNSYIVILINNIDLDSFDNNISVRGSVYVTTDINHILLTKNRNRLLELADAVVQSLDGMKLSSAGIIKISSISHTIINEKRLAYNISFTFTDQQVRKAEI